MKIALSAQNISLKVEVPDGKAMTYTVDWQKSCLSMLSRRKPQLH